MLKTHMVTLALVLGFTRLAGAAGPIETSVARGASNSQRGHGNRSLMKWGVGAMIVGGTLIVLTKILGEVHYCVVDGDILAPCGVNKGVLGSGIGLLAGGAVMVGVGARTRSPEIIIQRGAIGIRQGIRF
jgi:hypothetical protein